MAKKFMRSTDGAGCHWRRGDAFAQEGAKPAKAAEGTLMLQGKNYPLTHALAYETTVNEEEVIAVVLSGQAISSESSTRRGKRKRMVRTLILNGPTSSCEFTKAGALKFWSAGAGNTSLGRRTR